MAGAFTSDGIQRWLGPAAFSKQSIRLMAVAYSPKQLCPVERKLSFLICRTFVLAALALLASQAALADSHRFEVTDYAAAGDRVDQSGHADASGALSRAIAAANEVTARGEPACVHIPAGTYRLVSNPPPFRRAGCILGDGPTQTILNLDSAFSGDLFAWSEAWAPTTPGPTITGITINGNRAARAQQNALIFYDRNDEVFIDNVVISNLPGRALYSGARRNAPKAYMRESHMRSLRFFGDGLPGVPVVEFTSQGTGNTDATNEIRLSQVDVYGAYGPSVVIRNAGDGVLRYITMDDLRIEGTERGTTKADLLTIGDTTMRGRIGSLTFSNIELLDPYRGFAAIRLTGPARGYSPTGIYVSGLIDGGLSFGQGLRVDSGRASVFRFSKIHTDDTNITIGSNARNIVLDGSGQENRWTYLVAPASSRQIFFPVLQKGIPSEATGIISEKATP